MARYRNPDSEENIKRIDTPKRAKKQTHGFQVHFLRGDVLSTKMFSDGVSGGKEKARKAARKFRRAQRRNLPEPVSVTLPFRRSAVGYSFREHKNRGGTVTNYISASARPEKGHAVSKQFRIEGDDYDAAVAKALRWRKSLINKRLKTQAAQAVKARR